jgi:hypothetical protein
MGQDQLALLAAVLSGALFLLFRNWRLTLAALSVQYLGVFIWVREIWGLELAAIKLIAGWMAVAILGATLRGAAADLDDDDTGILFKLFLIIILLLVAWSSGGEVGSWLAGVTQEQGLAGIILVGTALIRLGFHTRALQIVLCLLFLFSGFELWFAVFEDSALTAVLLGVSNLALSLVGAFLHGQETAGTAVLPE